jgi:hypothetical protein
MHIINTHTQTPWMRNMIGGALEERQTHVRELWKQEPSPFFLPKKQFRKAWRKAGIGDRGNSTAYVTREAVLAQLPYQG